MIRGITFSEQAFYSKDFAHYQNFFLNRQSGITKGCAVSQDGTQVTIGTGYFIAHGRLLNIEDAEALTEESGFVDGYNRIVYEIDLSKVNSITKFQQGSIKVLTTEDLIQEDLDDGGNIYQMPFCHFTWNGIAISDFVIDAPTLVLDNIFADVSANFDSINETFQTWLNEQQTAATEWTDQQKAAAKTEMDADVKTIDDYAATCKAAMDEDVSSVDSHATAAKEVIDGVVDDLAGTTIGANGIGYDNTVSGLEAGTVQAAVDELADEKIDKEEGKGLSTNDYTTAEKTKLAGIAAGATATKVKGDAESAYRTGNVNLTPANLGLSGTCTRELLWENASPTSEFAAQTITLDLSEYDGVALEIKPTTSSTTRDYLIAKKNYTALYQTHLNVTNSNALYVVARLFTISSAGVTGDTEAHKNISNPATVINSNTYAIPTAIYGIKEVV